jgi:hypothetical protein
MLAANPKKSNDKFELRKRVRFGMSRKSIKALLEELNDCNKELERFTDKSEKIETLRKAVKPSFANRLQRIQKYATSLHETLNMCWSCSCSTHSTSLELDRRGSLYASGMRTARLSSKTCFKVSFSSGPDAQLWRCQAAEIVVEDEDDSCDVLHLSPKPKYVRRPPTASRLVGGLSKLGDSDHLVVISTSCYSYMTDIALTLPTIG